jgi:hypothetical protein
MSKNVMAILELGRLESNQQHLMFQGDDFDADISVRILHEGEDHPTTRETLENLATTLALRRPPKLSKFCICCNTLP